MSISETQTHRPQSMMAMLNAGVEAIAESGIDRISVSQIAKLTGHTRPTFYSYFGDTNGLLAEIWLEWGVEWLDRLADINHQVASGTLEEQQRNLALTEIFAIAHRSTEVLEVVQPAVAKWWSQFDGLTDLAKLKLVWLMGERLGTTLTAAIDPAAASAAFIEQVIAVTPNEPSIHVANLEPRALPKVSSPKVAKETTESQLIQATVDVIAASGAAAASMARIARRGQVSTGTIYPRFANLTDLVDASFELSVNSVIEQNFSLMSSTNFEPDDFGLFVMAGLTEPRKNWRNFRIEIHLEGRIRAGLKKRIAQNLQESNARVSEKLEKYEFPKLVAGPIPYLIHSVGIGFAMLQNAGLEILAFDHRIITRELVNNLVKIGK
jgi:AcrR family transcriptional regulator